MSELLNLPPFPPLAWRESFGSGDWKGAFVLPAWAGCLPGRGPYMPRDLPAPSDGSVSLSVDSPDRVGALPTPEQAAAFRHLVDHQQETRDAILRAVFDSYPDEQEACGWEGADAAERMPDLQKPEGLRALIGLSTVYLLAVAKDGFAYVSFEFRCLWDQEHGLGAMTHAGRVVQVGGADTAILEWIAMQDAENVTPRPPILGE